MLYKLSQKNTKWSCQTQKTANQNATADSGWEKGHCWVFLVNSRYKELHKIVWVINILKTQYNITPWIQCHICFQQLLKYVSHQARFGFRREHQKRKKYVQISFKNIHGCQEPGQNLPCSSFDLIRDMEEHFPVAFPARAGPTNASAGKGSKLATAPSLVLRGFEGPRASSWSQWKQLFFHF